MHCDARCEAYLCSACAFSSGMYASRFNDERDQGVSPTRRARVARGMQERAVDAEHFAFIQGFTYGNGTGEGRGRGGARASSGFGQQIDLGVARAQRLYVRAVSLDGLSAYAVSDLGPLSTVGPRTASQRWHTFCRQWYGLGIAMQRAAGTRPATSRPAPAATSARALLEAAWWRAFLRQWRLLARAAVDREQRAANAAAKVERLRRRSKARQILARRNGETFRRCRCSNCGELDHNAQRCPKPPRGDTLPA